MNACIHACLHSAFFCCSPSTCYPTISTHGDLSHPHVLTFPGEDGVPGFAKVMGPEGWLLRPAGPGPQGSRLLLSIAYEKEVLGTFHG